MEPPLRFSRRTDAFPNNARIRKLAEELRTMEQESLEDFLRSYIRKPKKEERSCMAARYREES
jgi:hypothetical protein